MAAESETFRDERSGRRGIPPWWWCRRPYRRLRRRDRPRRRRARRGRTRKGSRPSPRRKMTAFYRQHQIARCRDVGGGDMHVDAERRRACRADRGCRCRRRSSSRSAANAEPHGPRATSAGGRPTTPAQYRPRKPPAGDLDFRRQQIAGQPAGRDRKNHRFNLDRRHTLGAIHRLADRLFGLGQIDHTARFGAARRGVAETDHLDGVAPARKDLLRRMRP